jgi:hypothetical protein
VLAARAVARFTRHSFRCGNPLSGRFMPVVDVHEWPGTLFKEI